MNNLKLRQVTMTDIELTFTWSNDTETRKNSFNQNQILWDEHVVWFKNAIEDKNILFYVLTNDVNTEIGQIRIKFNENKEGVVSFSIDKNYRNKGFGTMILKLAEEKIKEKFPTYKLLAFVKCENIASQKAFIANGYQKVYSDSTSIEYTKEFKR